MKSQGLAIKYNFELSGRQVEKHQNKFCFKNYIDTLRKYIYL